MTLQFLFWFLWLLMLIFGAWRGLSPNGDRWYGGGSLILLGVLFIVGLKLFGWPLKG